MKLRRGSHQEFTQVSYSPPDHGSQRQLRGGGWGGGAATASRDVEWTGPGGRQSGEEGLWPNRRGCMAPPKGDTAPLTMGGTASLHGARGPSQGGTQSEEGGRGALSPALECPSLQITHLGSLETCTDCK